MLIIYVNDVYIIFMKVKKLKNKIEKHKNKRENNKDVVNVKMFFFVKNQC